MSGTDSPLDVSAVERCQNPPTLADVIVVESGLRFHRLGESREA